MLSGIEIENQIKKGNIYIEDFDHKRLNPNSYNLRLYSELQVYKSTILDMKKKNETDKIFLTDKGYKLIPGVIYLARTIEGTSTHGFVPCINGRSSIGRLGISVHITAGFGDNGFTSDFWTLEISVVQPITIYPNIEICQIYYEPIEGDPSMKYHGKYQNKKIMASELYREL